MTTADRGEPTVTRDAECDTRSPAPSCVASRYGPQPRATPNRLCPMCGIDVSTSARARYCSAACKQRAHRLRAVAAKDDDRNEVMAAELKALRALVANTVYECSSCEARYLAAWRCPDCNLMCRRLGLGGSCPHCDELVVISDLVPDSPSGRTS